MNPVKKVSIFFFESAVLPSAVLQKVVFIIHKAKGCIAADFCKLQSMGITNGGVAFAGSSTGIFWFFGKKFFNF